MKRFTLIFVLISLVVGIMVGCGADKASDNKVNSNSEQEKENVEKEEETDEESSSNDIEQEVSTTLEEIIEEKSGKYAGNAYNEAIVHRDLDDNSFQDKDSFQVYNYLLSLMSESETYKGFYEDLQNFNDSIETSISSTPEGMKLEDGQTVNGTSNIAILLDASGSMAQKIGGKTKMELAKQAVNEFVASMPEGSNISLRVYGHKGSNSDKDKKASCSSTELVYELNSYDESTFKESLNSFKPTGWTPIANAINETKKDFEQVNNEAQNIIYVVSDGVETCDGDPVKAAKELHDSNIKAVVNIIGFDVDQDGQKQLLQVAEAGGGKFETVDSADDFKKVWERERVRLYNEWSSWSAENYNDIATEQSKKINKLYSSKSDFSNLTYDEKKHLNEAVYYLKNKEQISSEVREELLSLINQRHNILDDYQEEYKASIEEIETEGKRLKEEIQDKGKEMKDKYSN
ncbi:ribosomal protein L12E/L44/L45/RPP1/RPP2/gas vesicle protein [Metabacillus crassostreae]|uniref:VWA domain-containing protein n=1 Tax=Metabacillus crassostreae TaxID=929098 RepID=UPI001957B7D8|nr:VWA domain-containing protein [Metabacillus crassostreae]MBM7605185.1 ribosomal protein L12E/L44/L45/RPP1/RPP2/gas vesicle protein [Metabacillus crassostreae]